ncbi:MAG: hypothetical protein U9Q66_00550 [Patescibacteria group bacterium]|nr:hypothetical protein [Patescibacteria group bacterium]
MLYYCVNQIGGILCILGSYSIIIGASRYSQLGFGNNHAVLEQVSFWYRSQPAVLTLEKSILIGTIFVQSHIGLLFNIVV